jgi:hypothetical protein
VRRRRVRLVLGNDTIAAELTHAGLDRRTIRGAGVEWLGRVRDVFYDKDKAGAKCDHSKSLCHRCGEAKDRKGGTNVNHVFICAQCAKGER